MCLLPAYYGDGVVGDPNAQVQRAAYYKHTLQHYADFWFLSFEGFQICGLGIQSFGTLGTPS